MGIRYNEPDWKHRLNGLLEKHKAEIEQILASYGVPLLDGQGKPIRKASVDADDAASSAEAVPEPAGYRTENYRAAVPAGLTGARTVDVEGLRALIRSEEHTSELQSLMRNSYAVFCLKKKKKTS